MSQAAPPSDKSGKSASSPLAPPDERFWQRYSPHAEFPLSGAGSFVLHILIFGLLGLMAWLGTILFNNSSRTLPVEAVVLSGGGGSRRGVGDGDNKQSAPVEAGNQAKESQAENLPSEDVPPPSIKVDPTQETKPQFQDQPGRKIQVPDEASNALTNLSSRVARIKPLGSRRSSGPGYGQGGSGSGGGTGDGKGTGTGRGNGKGSGSLTQSEKRERRWGMSFKTDNSADYLDQLKGLGAILAIPIRENGNGFDYRIIRNLSARPARLLDEGPIEKVRETERMIGWLDDNPYSARSVIRELRVPSPKVTAEKLHFIAFMPKQVEQKLLRLELDYLHKGHPSLTEGDIEYTRFSLNKIGKREYEPEVVDQKLNK